jgi:SAM-dependent methyltransferase
VPYDADLAAVHDQVFSALAEAAASALLRELGRSGRENGTVVDLGCGGGVLCAAVGAAGYHALGVDFSPEMIALARRRAPRAELRVGSIFDTELPRCLAVVAVGECVNYRFDSSPAGGGTIRGLRRLARRVYDALEPGGLFLFDAAAPGRVSPGGVRAHHEGDGWAVLMDAELETAEHLVRRITTFRRHGRGYRRSHEVHRLRLFDPALVLGVLRAAGFRARTARRYGELELPPGLVAYRARKP